MSFGIDVNILLYATDVDSPLHPRAAAFLQTCAEDGAVFCLAWVISHTIGIRQRRT